jgi:hypothetical protein
MTGRKSAFQTLYGVWQNWYQENQSELASRSYLDNLNGTLSDKNQQIQEMKDSDVNSFEILRGYILAIIGRLTKECNEITLSSAQKKQVKAMAQALREAAIAAGIRMEEGLPPREEDDLPELDFGVLRTVVENARADSVKGILTCDTNSGKTLTLAAQIVKTIETTPADSTTAFHLNCCLEEQGLNCATLSSAIEHKMDANPIYTKPIRAAALGPALGFAALALVAGPLVGFVGGIYLAFQANMLDPIMILGAGIVGAFLGCLSPIAAIVVGVKTYQDVAKNKRVGLLSDHEESVPEGERVAKENATVWTAAAIATRQKEAAATTAGAAAPAAAKPDALAADATLYGTMYSPAPRQPAGAAAAAAAQVDERARLVARPPSPSL